MNVNEPQASKIERLVGEYDQYRPVVVETDLDHGTLTSTDDILL